MTRPDTPYLKLGNTDWLLAGIATVIAAFALASSTGDQRDGTVLLSDVRSIELPIKLSDGEGALPSEVRQAIGLSAEPGADRKQRILALQALVASQAPWAHQLRLIVAAIALSYQHDRIALEELQHVTSAPEAMTRWGPLATELESLTRGAAAQDLASLTTTLSEIGASEWLQNRVRTRHYQNIGMNDASRQANERARQHGTELINALQLGGIIAIVLFVFGGLLLLAWPLLRGVMINAGFVGMISERSAFERRHTVRVILAWFVGGFLASIALSWLAELLAPLQDAPMRIAMTTLLHGGLAITFIQRYGRVVGDPSPLHRPLRMGVRHAPRGLLGVTTWLALGIPMTVFAAVGAVFLNSLLLGDPAQQGTLELLVQADDLESRILLISAAVLFAPIFEEILFRGFVYQNLRARLGSFVAMIASGLIFGIVHLDLGALLPLSVLGGCLAFLYERSGTLLVPMVVHGLWNLATIATSLTLLS